MAEWAGKTLRSNGDTPCDLDIYGLTVTKGEYWRCGGISLTGKVAPMLPEPTLPKRRRAAPAQPWAMTPLFAVPDSTESASSEPDVIPSPARQVTRPPGRGRRPNSRLSAGRANRGAAAGNAAMGKAGIGKGGSHKEPADLLAVTAERLRRALGRSFLRYGISGDLETAVHAAMNVIEPVLDARDTEILRLRRLMGGKLPGR